GGEPIQFGVCGNVFAAIPEHYGVLASHRDDLVQHLGLDDCGQQVILDHLPSADVVATTHELIDEVLIDLDEGVHRVGQTIKLRRVHASKARVARLGVGCACDDVK